MRRLGRFLARIWGLLLCIAGWELVTWQMADPFFPRPSVIIQRMFTMWFRGPASHLFLSEQAVSNFAPSLLRLTLAWVTASVAGVVLGVALGRTPWLNDYLDPLLQFGRAVPPPVILPIFLVLFEIGPRMQVATIVFGIIWPILLNSVEGARGVDPLQIETARVFKVSRSCRFFGIILPAAAPKIFAGLRLSVSLALILMVISELAGSTDGIGYLLNDARSVSDMPALWAVITLLGILGLVLNALFIAMERRILAWHIGSRQNT